MNREYDLQKLISIRTVRQIVGKLYNNPFPRLIGIIELISLGGFALGMQNSSLKILILC